MKTNRKQQLQMLDSAFNRLERCCESASEWNQFLDLNRDEENQHRTLKPDHVDCGLTKAQAVRFFAVQGIFQRFGMPNFCVCGWQGANSVCLDCGKNAQAKAVFTPTAEEFFHIRGSCFAAVALAHMFQEKIWAEFDRLEMIEWLATVDYVELNRDQRKVVAA